VINGEPDWLVFFSPSGVEAVRKNGVDAGGYRLAAIGDTTAAAIDDAGYTAAAVADAPEPEAVVAAITGA
jgi:uroporphyrinogen-III synthase